MKLSKLAETQLNEIQYAFGCSKQKAISYALESLHAFETLTNDQIYNWLDDNKKQEFLEWQMKHKDDRVPLKSN